MMQYFKRPWMIQPFINQMVKCNVRQHESSANARATRSDAKNTCISGSWTFMLVSYH